MIIINECHRGAVHTGAHTKENTMSQENLSLPHKLWRDTLYSVVDRLALTEQTGADGSPVKVIVEYADKP